MRNAVKAVPAAGTRARRVRYGGSHEPVVGMAALIGAIIRTARETCTIAPPGAVKP